MERHDAFHDYTLASHFEKLVAVLEQTLRAWLNTGFASIVKKAYSSQSREQPSLVKVQASLQHRLPWRSETYLLQLHLPTHLPVPKPVGLNALPPRPAPARSSMQKHKSSSSTAAGASGSQLAGSGSGSGSQLSGSGSGSGSQLAGSGSGSGSDTLVLDSSKVAVESMDVTGTIEDPPDSSVAISEFIEQDEGSMMAEESFSLQGIDVKRDPPPNGKNEEPTSGDPSWEVGVDLDLRELQESINVIMAATANNSRLKKLLTQHELDRLRGGDMEENLQDGAEEELTNGWMDVGEEEEPTGRMCEGEEPSSRMDVGGLTSGRMVVGEETRVEAMSESTGTRHVHGTRTLRGSSSSEVQLSRDRLVHGSKEGGADGGSASVVLPTLSRASDDAVHAGPKGSSDSGGMNGSRQTSARLSKVSDSGGMNGSRQTSARLSKVSDTSKAGPNLVGKKNSAQENRQVVSGWWPNAPVGRRWWQHSRQHKLQRWFGLDHFLVLLPNSFSRRLWDESEATTLMSAVSVALGGMSLSWPVLLPVHDALRDAYWGTASLPGCTMHFQTDSIHVSNIPASMLTLQGQLMVFAEQLLPSSPGASSACLAAAAAAASCSLGDPDPWGSTTPASTVPHSDPSAHSPHTPQQQQEQQQQEEEQQQGHSKRFDVSLTASYTYRLPFKTFRLGSAQQQASESPRSVSTHEYDTPTPTWDATAPWQPWASQQDPVRCLELDITWEDLSLLAAPISTPSAPDDGDDWSSVLQPHRAAHWVLHALQRGYSDCGRRRGLAMRPDDRERTHVELQHAGADWLWTAEKALRWQRLMRDPTPGPAVRDRTLGGASFSVMLSSLMGARSIAAEADDLGELAGDLWWEERGVSLPPVPPLIVLHDSVMKDLFDLQGSDSGDSWSMHSSGDADASSPSYPRTCPVNSLLTRLALHCMLFGNVRAIAVLWQHFMRKLRFSHWETLTPLPRMSSGYTSDGAPATSTMYGGPTHGGIDEMSNLHLEGPSLPDLTSTLLQQKLQMLNLCIHRMKLHQATAALEAAARQSSSRTTREGGACHHSSSRTPKKSTDGTMCATSAKVSPDRLSATQGRPNASGGTAPQGSLSLDRLQRSDSLGQESPASVGGKTSQGRTTASRGTPPQGSMSLDRFQSSDSLGQDSVASMGGKTGQGKVTEEDSTTDGWDLEQESGMDGVSSATQGGSLPAESKMESDTQSDSEHSYFSASENEDFVGGRPEGVFGVLRIAQPDASSSTQEFARLSRHPDRPLRIPITQPPPAYTEDRMLERQAAMEGLMMGSVPEGSELANRLATGLLTSDMAAFKAANPGAVIEDFLRWYSPRDVKLDAEGDSQLSERMTSSATSGPAKEQTKEAAGTTSSTTSWAVKEPSKEAAGTTNSTTEGAATIPSSNPWHILWDTTMACPASKQKPLQDPALEGERVLHDLDTIQPGDLFDQLVAVSIAAAVQMLASAEGAKLPAVHELVHKYNVMSRSILKTGISLLADCPSAHEEGVRWSALRGYEDAALEFVLAEFHFLEQAVVFAQSLCSHLLNSSSMCNDLLQRVIDGPRPKGVSIDSPAPGTAGDKGGGHPDATRYTLHPGHLSATYATTNSQKAALAAALCASSHVHMEESDAVAAMAEDSRNPSPLEGGERTAVMAENARNPLPLEGDERTASSAMLKFDLQMQKMFHPQWPTPCQREWVISCQAGSNESKTNRVPPSRMYVMHSDAEMRIATGVVNE